MLFPLQAPDCLFNLLEYISGNRIDRSTQNGEGFMGVELCHMFKVLRNIIPTYFIAAPLQEHKAHTVFQGDTEPDRQIEIIQFSQKTVCFHKMQILQMLFQLFLYLLSGGLQQKPRYVRIRRADTEF